MDKLFTSSRTTKKNLGKFESINITLTLSSEIYNSKKLQEIIDFLLRKLQIKELDKFERELNNITYIKCNIWQIINIGNFENETISESIEIDGLEETENALNLIRESFKEIEENLAEQYRKIKGSFSNGNA